MRRCFVGCCACSAGSSAIQVSSPCTTSYTISSNCVLAIAGGGGGAASHVLGRYQHGCVSGNATNPLTDPAGGNGGGPGTGRARQGRSRVRR